MQPADWALLLQPPQASDDKYARGTVGLITGSLAYPGAAILSASGAVRSGAGLVRFLGPETVGRLLLEVRPEVVLQSGRANTWVVGCGVASDDTEQVQRIESLIAAGVDSLVADAGALEIIDFSETPRETVLTPHAGEAARLLTRLGMPTERSAVEADPMGAAEQIAGAVGRTVLLKGHASIVVSQVGSHLTTRRIAGLSSHLATAGSGDVLAGVLGALMAARSNRGLDLSLADVVEAAVLLHSRAAEIASRSGTVAALDVAESLRAAVAELGQW